MNNNFETPFPNQESMNGTGGARHFELAGQRSGGVKKQLVAERSSLPSKKSDSKEGGELTDSSNPTMSDVSNLKRDGTMEVTAQVT